jgi:hypothetical protein
MGELLGAIIPPIGQWAITLSCIVSRCFKAIRNTTEHDGLRYHRPSRAWFSFYSRTLLTCQDGVRMSVTAVTF